MLHHEPGFVSKELLELELWSTRFDRSITRSLDRSIARLLDRSIAR